MLEWNVYVSDFNNKKIVEHNVFDHWGVMADLRKAARKYRDKERAAFEEEMKNSLMYWYWSKCEWEIILDHWPTKGEEYQEKIDVFDQIKLNWANFCDYVWAHRAELRRREKKDGSV